MSEWPTSEADLDHFADYHLYYEVKSLLGQAAFLELHYPNLRNPVEDAVLEAALVHVRLLDEFLGGSPNPYDARASCWLPSWTGKHFLEDDDRIRIGGQVVHLAHRRDDFYRWDVPALTRDCCAALIEFLDALEGSDPRRARAFGESRALIGVSAFAPPA